MSASSRKVDARRSAVLAALIWPAVKFLLIDAVWTGSSREDCTVAGAGRTVGACWPFIAAKFRQFMYGFYPAEEQWRVNLTYAIAVVLLVRREPIDRGATRFSIDAPEHMTFGQNASQRGTAGRPDFRSAMSGSTASLTSASCRSPQCVVTNAPAFCVR